jgi:hypothetical protein
VVCHKGKPEAARKGDACGKLSCEEINHRYGKGSKYERNNSEVSFRLCKRVKEVGKNKEQRRMEVSGVLFVKFYLVC